MKEKNWKKEVNKLIKELMREYSLEIDDIRWLLASRLTDTILSYSQSPEELTKLIWKGKLESDLYNMEESFLFDIENQLERNLLDEAWIRENFAEASALKCRRNKT